MLGNLVDLPHIATLLQSLQENLQGKVVKRLSGVPSLNPVSESNVLPCIAGFILFQRFHESHPAGV